MDDAKLLGPWLLLHVCCVISAGSHRHFSDFPPQGDREAAILEGDSIVQTVACDLFGFDWLEKLKRGGGSVWGGLRPSQIILKSLYSRLSLVYMNMCEFDTSGLSQGGF